MNNWLVTRASRGAGWNVAAVATLVLAGCGGGGGGGNAGTPPDPVVPSAEVSSSSLESSPEPVLAATTDIDDSGRVSVLFAQSVGGRVALQAVRGVPGARGVAPVFELPVVIDAQAPYDGSGQLGLALSPAGHAVAVWSSVAPCTALTYNTTGNCKYFYTARRLATGSWEAPVLVGDTPGALSKAIINNAGDVVLLWPSWRRDGAGVLSLTNGVVWKTNAASQFTTPTEFNDIQTPAGTEVGFTLDSLGNMAYVSMSTNAGVQTVVARRGSLSAGFGNTERLDTQSTNAQLEGLWGGVNGQAVVLWQQASAGQMLRWSATLDGPNQAWQVSERGAPRTVQQPARSVKAAVADNGDFFRYDLENCVAVRRSGGTWQAETALPPGVCQPSTSFSSVVSRAGDVVGGLVDPAVTAGNTGQWLSYDASPSALTHALGAEPVPYLLGTATTLGGNLLLSENGVAALVAGNDFDMLPSAAAPAGTRGAATNLWVVYLKLP